MKNNLYITLVFASLFGYAGHANAQDSLGSSGAITGAVEAAVDEISASAEAEISEIIDKEVDPAKRQERLKNFLDNNPKAAERYKNWSEKRGEKGNVDPQKMREFMQERRERRQERREEFKEKRGEMREESKERREEFREDMKERRQEFHEDMKEKRGEFREERKEERGERREERREERGERRDEHKEDRMDRREDRHEERGERREQKREERGDKREDRKQDKHEEKHKKHDKHSGLPGARDGLGSTGLGVQTLKSERKVFKNSGNVVSKQAAEKETSGKPTVNKQAVAAKYSFDE